VISSNIVANFPFSGENAEMEKNLFIGSKKTSKISGRPVAATRA